MIFATLSLLASAGSYAASYKINNVWLSYGVFALFAIAVIILMLGTGGVFSPFIALFLLVAFFAGIFSYSASLPLLIFLGIFTGAAYINHEFNSSFVVSLLFTGVIPLIAGFIVWYGRSGGEDTADKRQVKQIANELSEVASASEVIINAIGDGVMAINAQGAIELINPAAQKLLGWSKQDALTLNYKSVLHLLNRQNKDLDPSLDPVQQALNTNQEIRNNDINVATKTGQKFIASIVVSPISQQAGSGVIAMFHDITKEKKEEHEQAEFISTASHEMRTPVASIEGYLGLALNPNVAKIDDKAKDFIMKAQDAAKHLGRLFQDLLDVSKAEDGRMTNTPKVLDVVPFVGEIVQGLTQKAIDKGLKITYVPNGSAGQKTITPTYYVNLDNDHIREVTDNLVENAIKYTPSGEVVVDVTGDNDKVIISIKDSGIGIPAEDIPHLFQKFYRVENEETNQIGGTGLGLYLARRLVEAMDGRLWVESEYKKGSTFYVELPRIDSTTAEALRQEQANQIQAQPTQPETPAVGPDGMPPVVAPPSPEQQDETKPDLGSNGVAVASTVPRGEVLTDEQKAAHVARLKQMIAAQQAAQSSQAADSNQTTGQTPS